VFLKESAAVHVKQAGKPVPLITVGIPVFNAMPYLVESVESILGQDCGDFEVLVINDGSTDDSLTYLQSLRDPRLRIINQKNQGLTATLNHMLAEARTPWLVRHDADDVAYPHRLARTLEYINQHPRSGMFCSLAEYYPRGCYGQFRATRGSPRQFRDLVMSGYLPAICHPTVTLNVERAMTVGGYRFELHVEDIDLWWRMALQYDIRLIPEVTLGFRQNSKSISSANLAKQALNTLYIQYLLLSHLWRLTPMPYNQACQQLSCLLGSRKLEFKRHLREFNIELGQGNRCKALGQLGSAFWVSPGSFARRVFDEFFPRGTISLGERPEIFDKYRNVFWPLAGTHLEAEETAQPLRTSLKGNPLLEPTIYNSPEAPGAEHPTYPPRLHLPPVVITRG
jgi:glycosyltransferase involved in cell wall biosynthesis